MNKLWTGLRPIFARFTNVGLNCKFKRLAHHAEVPAGSDANRYKLYKRIFSIALFVTTITVADILRRRKQKASEDPPPLPNSTYQDILFGKLRLVTYKGFSLPDLIIPTIEALKNFEFKESDVVLTSFPKSGVTWLQEIVWLIHNNYNFDTALAKSLEDRVPFLEWPLPGINNISNQPSPRIIKTHIPPCILFNPLGEGDPDYSQVKPKIITIVRNFKDLSVSFYLFCRMNKLIDYQEDYDLCLVKFMSGEVPYGPVEKHIIDVLKAKRALDGEIKPGNDKHILLIHYEDLHFHFDREINRICDFLGYPRPDETQLTKLKTHCSFNSMSKNPMVNYQHWDSLGLRNPSEARFFRKGKVGNWQEFLDKYQSYEIERFHRATLGGIIEFTYGDEDE